MGSTRDAYPSAGMSVKLRHSGDAHEDNDPARLILDAEFVASLAEPSCKSADGRPREANNMRQANRLDEDYAAILQDFKVYRA